MSLGSLGMLWGSPLGMLGPWDPHPGWVEMVGSPDPATGTGTFSTRSKSSHGEIPVGF